MLRRSRLSFIALLLPLLAVACTGDEPSQLAAAAREQQALVAELLADPAATCATTGTDEDVQAYISQADDQGRAGIPAGCYEMSRTVVVPSGTRLVGAGAEQTILYWRPGHMPGKKEAMLWVPGRDVGEALTSISGLSFIGLGESGDTAEDHGLLLANVRDFRVDHCYFEGFGWAALRVEGDSRGLVDHSTFVDNYKPAINNLGYGVVVYGDEAWAEDPRAGTAEAVFVEDSYFSGNRHAIAAGEGAHYVFRHNEVTDNVMACAVDAHGFAQGAHHGTRFVEIYENDISRPADDWCGIGIRGGDGVIFNNRISGYENPVLLIVEWGMPAARRAAYPAFEQIRALYIWNNDISGGPVDPQLDEEAGGLIARDRDYFLAPMPGYSPYAYPHPLSR